MQATCGARRIQDAPIYGERAGFGALEVEATSQRAARRALESRFASSMRPFSLTEARLVASGRQVSPIELSTGFLALGAAFTKSRASFIEPR
jgi:hypothetical protein